MEWETIDDSPATDIHRTHMVTQRAKVLGGWLVRFWKDDDGESGISGLAFVADPSHDWDPWALVLGPDDDDED